MREQPQQTSYTMENHGDTMENHGDAELDRTPAGSLAAIMTEELEKRFRSESEPIMGSTSGSPGTSSLRNSNVSLASSITTSDRDSIISTSSGNSMDANFEPNSELGGLLNRNCSTRSAPSATLVRGGELQHNSDGYYEDDEIEEGLRDCENEETEKAEIPDGEADDEFPGSPIRKSFTQSTIGRKAAIRRVHTVTPQASPKVRHRRVRINSKSSEDPTWKYEQQVSSSDSFNVTIDLPNCRELVNIQAKKQVTLREAIREILEPRNIDILTVGVYIETSTSPTPLDCECFLFANKTLYVRAKSHPRLLSGSDRTRSVSTSVVPSIHINNGLDTCPFQPKSRKDLSKFFGVEQDKQTRARRPSLPPQVGSISVPVKPPKVKPMDPKMRALKDKLDDYTVKGLPDFPSLMFFSLPQRGDDAELLKLEDNWRNVVDDYANLPKKVVDQQEAIFEIIRTEVTYIKNIRVIIDIYMTCLIDLQAAGILNSIVTEKIFSNIVDIESRHSKFWKEKLINVMKSARETRKPLSAAEVAKAFEGFGGHFEPYFKFCTEEESCMEFLREKEKDDEQLKFFLQWCQDHPDSRRLKLGDLLVYPMQMITRYPLLLKAIGKETRHNEGDKQAVFKQMAEVAEFLGKVNHEVRREQETKKMNKMILRIEAYDWPEPPSGSGIEELAKLSEECPVIDLKYPMPCACPSQPRWVVHEGTVKIRDQHKSGYEGTMVIFTDMVLICKRLKNSNLRIIRPPMRIDRLKCTELNDKSGFAMLSQDEYNCASAWYIVTTTATFTTPNGWMDKITKAKEMYEDACSNKDMEKFLDMSYTTNTGLQLPDFLKIPETSPQASPQNSPVMPRNFKLPTPLLKKANSARELVRLRGEEQAANKHRNVENGTHDNSSEEDSQDADTENSDSGDSGTPTLVRPTDLRSPDAFTFNADGKLTLPKQDTLSPDDFTYTGRISPASPNPQAMGIMAFDDDFDDEEDPSDPTPFALIPQFESNTLPKRGKNKMKFNTLTKAVTSRVTKLQHDQGGQGSSEEESVPDEKSKKNNRKKSKGARFFGIS